MTNTTSQTGNWLAFDTGTELMSVALRRGDAGPVQEWHHTAPGGSRASSELIPAILGLLQQADLQFKDLQAICFGAGPGSFTGLRTACAVAQGLAFGADRPVLPVDSLLAVAEEARHSALNEHQRVTVSALLDARMGEIYAATWVFDHGVWTRLHASALVQPDDLAHFLPPPNTPHDAPWIMAGNVFAVYGDRLEKQGGPRSAVPQIVAQPTARAMLRLVPQLARAGQAVAPHLAWPVYVRDKVAKTTAERAAEKSALQRAVAP